MTPRQHYLVGLTDAQFCRWLRTKEQQLWAWFQLCVMRAVEATFAFRLGFAVTFLRLAAMAAWAALKFRWLRALTSAHLKAKRCA